MTELRSLPTSQNPSPLLSADTDEARTRRLIGMLYGRLRAFARAHLIGTRGIIIAGSISTLLYVLIASAYPLLSWWNHPDYDLSIIAERSSWTHFLSIPNMQTLPIWMGLVSTCVIIILYGMQMLALFATRHMANMRRARWLLIGFAIIFIVIMIGMQPTTSTDLYGYAARSYLIATFHLNPTISLSAFLSNSYLVPHARPPAPYGALWLLLCGADGYIAGDDVLLALIILKIIMAIFAIATILLLAWLADRMVPGERIQAVAFFAWSPLLIFEGIGNGHNDIVMVFFVVLAFAMLAIRRPMLAIPALTLSVAVKYSMGVLLPLFVVYIVIHWCWKTENEDALQKRLSRLPHSWRSLWNDYILGIVHQINWPAALRMFGGSAAISLGLLVACYAPFWAGLKTFTGLSQQLGSTYYFLSPTQFIFYGIQALLPNLSPTGTGSAVHVLFYGILFIYTLGETWRLLRIGSRVTLAALAQSAGRVVFVLLIFATFWYQAWYILWIVPLAALAPDGALRRNATMLTFGGLITYPIFYFSFRSFNPSARSALIQFCMMLSAFGFLLIFRQNRTAIWQQFTQRWFSRIGTWTANYPRFTNQVMLVLILAIAAMLRLVQLGTIGGSLRQVSGNLAVSVADVPGLKGIFAGIQQVTEAIFGATTFAQLLPTALVGTATVAAIYALAAELFKKRMPDRYQTLALLAALLAATAQWHVALSRSGVNLILLTLLITLAAIGLWRSRYATIQIPSRIIAARRWIAFSGVCLGMSADLEPYLWPVPLMIVICMLCFIIGLLWRDRQITNKAEHEVGQRHLLHQLAILLVTTGIIALPMIFDVSRAGGYGVSSPLTPSFWTRGIVNIGRVLHIIVTQDYSGAGPYAGGIPIVSGLMIPFVVIGAVLALRNWRRPEIRALGLIVILPFVATIAANVAPGIIAGATFLPALCLLGALGIEESANFIGTLPTIIYGPRNTIFISRPAFLRLALVLFITLLTVTTFIWYFASTSQG
jgi:hypothetical protein